MPTDGRQLLIANLALIERVIAFACRRNRLSENDAEEFASVVKLKLVENEYEILTRFEGRSRFSTFIAIVIQRMLLDFRIHAWGKWHASAEATRLGDAAVELEKLIHRDGRTFDEAARIVTSRHSDATRDSLAAIADRLPSRPPRRQMVGVEEAEALANTNHDAEQKVLARERHRTSERIGEALRFAIRKLPHEDSLILQLRFQSAMTVAQIARALGLDQKLLYRRLEQRLRELRIHLETEGFGPAAVLDLIGSDTEMLAFSGERTPAGPSSRIDNADAVPQPGETVR